MSDSIYSNKRAVRLGIKAILNYIIKRKRTPSPNETGWRIDDHIGGLFAGRIGPVV